MIRTPLLALTLVTPAWAQDTLPPAPFQTAAQVRAAVGQMPQPGTTPPPGVAVDSSLGSGLQYALANHTHATSVQRMKMMVSPAGQPVRWNFAKPYDPGVVPVVVCTAQNVAGATQPFVVNTSGDATNTYVDLLVYKAGTQTLGSVLTSIAGTVINLFSQAAPGTIVNCQAAKPTQ